MQLKNYGPATIGVTAQLQSIDPYLEIHQGTSSYGPIGSGAVASNGANPFSVGAAAYAPHGHVAEATLTASFPGGQTVSHLHILLGKWNYLVWDPSPDASSGPVIHQTLHSLGYGGTLTSRLPVDDLDGYQTIFVSLGIYGNNYVVSAGSAEGPALVAFLEQGGCAYLEGNDAWYYDPISGGFDFGPYFGIDGVADGVGDLNRVLGQTGTLAAGMNFAYAGENAYIDQLAPIQAGFALFRNNSPSYVCGVASDQAIYRTVGTSFEFGGLTDGAAPSTRAVLAQAIMEFFLPVDPQGAGEGALRAGLTYLAPARPQPCVGEATLRYGLAAGGLVHIGLYDASGRCVRVLLSRPQPAGAHELAVDMRELAAGVYFIRSQLGDRLLARKLVVTR